MQAQAAKPIRRGVLWLGAIVVAMLAAGGVAAEGTLPDPHIRVDTVFVIDNSGSMRANDPDGATHRLVVDFASGLPRNARLGIVVFDESARLVEPLTRAVGPGSSDRWAAVMRQVDYAGQLTNSPAGIERALYELKHNGRDGSRKAIVFMTDGIVDTGDPQRDHEKSRWLKGSLAAEGRRAGVRVFGIALGDEADVELVQALSSETGGEYWRVGTPNEIGSVLRGIGARIQQPLALARSDDPGPVVPLAGTLPPISSAPPARARGLVFLSLGLFVAALVLIYPAWERRRRRVRDLTPAFVPKSSMSRSAAAAYALPALPRQGRPPVVKLVDVSHASGRDDVVLLLEKPTTRIGRDPSNEVAVQSDTVSSFHATIDYQDGYFYLEDHRSTNGTRLNGQPLTPNQPIQLKSGDSIEVAGHEFRFLIPDHEPRGRTAAISATALPIPEPPLPVRRADRDGAAVSIAENERQKQAFRKCLDAHLAKVGRLGDAHRRFVARAFPEELVGLLSRRAGELVDRCLPDRTGDAVDLSKGGIHYTLCAIPETMGEARGWFAERYGSYAKFLVGLLDEWSERECEAICVITFGMISEPWVSVTIVPAREGGDAIEVISFEFLSEDERRAAMSLEIADAERAG